MSFTNLQPTSVNGSATFTFANLVVNGTSQLGSIGNVKITGGSSGQAIVTDGAGNLSFSTVSGGGGGGSTNPAGSNTQIQFNNAGSFGASANFTFNSTSNTLTVDNITSNIVSTGTSNLANVNLGGNIMPITANIYSLGSPSNYFKSAYIGPGSLYIDGQKVLQSNSGTIVVSANLNQDLQVTTSGSGGIRLNPTGSGVIAVQGTLQIQTGNNITSSDGNPIVFAEQINVDSVSAKTTNGDLTLAGNGSGNVHLNSNALVSGNLAVSGSSANLSVSGNATATYFIGNGSQLTGLPAAYANSNVASYLPTYTGNITGNIVTLSGNVTAANANLGNLVIANYHSGNGYLLSGITGANVTGTVANANYSLYAGTVLTNAQPNITSTGTLTSLSVTNDVTVGGNLVVNGTQTTINSTAITTNDLNIILANNASSAVQANGAGIKITGASANILYNSTSNSFTFSHKITADGSLLTSINGANVTGTVANATYATSAGTAGTVTTNAQPNITSVGTLTNLNVTNYVKVANIQDSTGTNAISTYYNSHAGDIGVTGNLSVGTGGTGNITASNASLGNLVVANYHQGVLTTAAQPNITSVGTLSSLAVTANANVSNIGASIGVFTGNLSTTGWLSIQQATETLNTKTGATGTVNHDISTGAVFIHTGISANFTANLQNVPTTNSQVISVSLFLNQGSTPYFANALQINGSATTIYWPNATAPTPTASRYEIQTFALLRTSGGTWQAYGSYNSFG